MSSLVVIVVIAFLLYLLHNILRKDRITKYVDQIPGPLKLPIIGTAYYFLMTSKKDLYKNFKQEIDKYGPIMRAWIGWMPIVLLSSPETVEVVLNSNTLITKNQMYAMVHPWLGDGLLTSTGAKWHRQRKLITPTFHFKILDNYMEVFNEKSKTLVKLLSAKAGTTFDLYPFITRCTLDIICETAMGVQVNAMSSHESPYVNSIYSISEIIFNRLTHPHLLLEAIFSKTKYAKEFNKCLSLLHKFTERVIRDRKELYQRSTETDKNANIYGMKDRKAFLDLLIEMVQKDNSLTNQELREQVDTFMFEGHDTTTAGICWTLFLLGNHPQIQNKVYEEVQSAFDHAGNNMTIADLGELKLLERCIKESLRLYPSVPVIGRRMTEDVKIGEYIVPAGCDVNLAIALVHKNENSFPNPERFDPDRFLPENSKNRHPFAFIPFSAGPRNCIGQKFAMYEEKTVLAHLLRNYEVQSVQSMESIVPVMDLILRPSDGLLVTLKSRQTN